MPCVVAKREEVSLTSSHVAIWAPECMTPGFLSLDFCLWFWVSEAPPPHHQSLSKVSLLNCQHTLHLTFFWALSKISLLNYQHALHLTFFWALSKISLLNHQHTLHLTFLWALSKISLLNYQHTLHLTFLWAWWPPSSEKLVKFHVLLNFSLFTRLQSLFVL